MAACTFFGHGDCPRAIAPRLQAAVEALIVGRGVTRFYVGDHGGFDALVRAALRRLQALYPQIEYAVVLAYLPKGGAAAGDTVLPEGIENTPRRFAISWRNRWMLRQSQYVITYITRPWGGAAQFAELARRQHKTVYNLAE